MDYIPASVLLTLFILFLILSVVYATGDKTSEDYDHDAERLVYLMDISAREAEIQQLREVREQHMQTTPGTEAWYACPRCGRWFSAGTLDDHIQQDCDGSGLDGGRSMEELCTDTPQSRSADTSTPPRT